MVKLSSKYTVHACRYQVFLQVALKGNLLKNKEVADEGEEMKKTQKGAAKAGGLVG